MISGNIDIFEVDVDGPPEEAGSYLLWLQGEGLACATIESSDLDEFEDNFDGVSWELGPYNVVAYTRQEFMELGYI